MEKERSSTPAALGLDAFQQLAEANRHGVRQIRERNRLRRLKWVLVGGGILLAYLLLRVVQDRPIKFGLPSLGPDAFLWFFPIVIIFAILAMVGLPMIIAGRSPGVRFSPEEIGIRFNNVRGIDTALEEVTRTLQIFLAYKTFKEDLGGNPRRGILFEGSPGTGKTHLAKAMAAEAGVPFFFVSAPAFQSMWQGMTSFRIRNFFKELKKAAAKEGGAIGFIEEIDAIGMARSGVSQMSGVSNMTIHRMGGGDAGGMVNELLIQMQSFESPVWQTRLKNRMKDVINAFLPSDHQLKKAEGQYNNVLIIAATNRADTLDPALLRPGRFDRILHFDLPSRAGRRELVDYFLERRSHTEEMDREDLRDELASMTLGYSPAMLEHVLDEALVWALRDGRRHLTWKDVQQARLSEEIGIGQPVAYTDQERKLIATHEAGHAVAAFLCAKEYRKLEVLSIIKRRSALGLLAHSDLEERFTKTRSELLATMKIMLGGMAAERLFFGESGTGPSSDLSAATNLAAQMVGAFGMGRSLISYEAVDNGAHSSPNLVAKILTNEDTRNEVDEILSRQRDEVQYLLEKNIDLVEALRDALLEREELLGDEINEVLEKALTNRS